MFFLIILASISTVSRTALAASIPPSFLLSSNNSTDIILSQLDAIIGGTSCPLEGSQFLDECRTAAQALPFVNKRFADYNITTLGEKAALLSLMSFESGGFQFNINHSPGNPGQGTRNLMEFPSHNKTASYISLSSLPSKLSNKTKNAIRAVVLGDGLSFGSAMWFYTQSGATRVGQPGPGCLQMPENYITNCVGTTVTDERKQSWLRTVKILNGNA
ncbi:hypothetical protein F5878DRAFT_574068 [Lentinula raphanica]|uniref:Uncharacterized protein n=1 Tax=Lentinula raphanica TaxID=153919 RepID=A0AA38UKC8_9AGAR|nr:hypothetical protein F5878DRAFT_574068 [Lentinula raphanica]